VAPWERPRPAPATKARVEASGRRTGKGMDRRAAWRLAHICSTAASTSFGRVSAADMAGVEAGEAAMMVRRAAATVRRRLSSPSPFPYPFLPAAPPGVPR